MCAMSFRGGTVGMPWKGKSIVGISSKTSACFFVLSVFWSSSERERQGMRERQFFFLFFLFPLSRLSLTSFSGGIAFRASQSQAPLPMEAEDAERASPPPPPPPRTAAAEETSVMLFFSILNNIENVIFSYFFFLLLSHFFFSHYFFPFKSSLFLLFFILFRQEPRVVVRLPQRIPEPRADQGTPPCPSGNSPQNTIGLLLWKGFIEAEVVVVVSVVIFFLSRNFLSFFFHFRDCAPFFLSFVFSLIAY